MKFHQTLFLIYLIGVEAKPKRQGVKVRSKAEKTQYPDGFRSLFDEGLQAGRSQLSDIQSGVNHGNIANGLSKYGHFGLNVDNDPGGDINSFNGVTADLSAAGQTILNGANPIKNQINPFDSGSKVKRSSSNDVGTKNLLDSRTQVEIRSQGSQSGAQFRVNGIPQQYSNLGQPPSYYGSAPDQDGLYGVPTGLSNVQTQSSSFGQTESYPHYGSAEGQVTQFGSLYGQGRAALGQPGGYPGFASPSGLGGDLGPLLSQGDVTQPGGYPGSGFGLGQGQGGQFGSPYVQSHIQAPHLIGQPASYYGTGLGQVGQPGAQLWQSGVQGQYANGGQPASYYGSLPGSNAMSRNGALGAPSLQGGVQSLYAGVGQPINYYGTAPGNNIQGHGGFLSWVTSSGTPSASGALGQNNGLLGNPTQPQVGLNLCPAGYGPFSGDGRCLPYCTSGQNVGCVSAPTSYLPYGLVPGPYGGMEKAIASNAIGAGDYQYQAIRPLSRYIAPGFYYPPPQHLNSNPNVWDPAARYYFAMDGQDLPKDASGPLPRPPVPSNAFPITYSQL